MEGLNVLILNDDTITAAGNILWAVLSLGLAISMGIFILRRVLLRKTDDAFWLMIGLFAGSVGEFVHRTGWTAWRKMRLEGFDPSSTESFISSSIQFTVPAVVLIAMGYIVHFRHLLQIVHKKHWFLWGAGYTVLVWCVAFVIIQS